MASAKISVPHRLTQAEALARIKRMLGELRERYGSQMSDFEEEWNDTTGRLSFKALSFRIQAEIKALPATVDLEVQFPFAALPFKGTIMTKVTEAANSLLSA